jgi:3-ketosteroid 9alpha-monooxygenase subunit A
MYGGWYRVAFTQETNGDVTPAAIGPLRLVLVRRPDGIAAYDAVCPHRGAHLGYGGTLAGDVVVCPFHGRRIGLGEQSGRPYWVRAYRTLDVGGSVFVLLSEQHENGLTAFIERLAPTHYFVPGFVLAARVAPEYVIENVFDTDHFRAVHGISRRPQLQVRQGDNGELSVEAVFETRKPNPWQEGYTAAHDGGGVKTRFLAHVFSPTLCASELGEEGSAQIVFTSATPTPDGSSIIRVSLAVTATAEGEPPPEEFILALMRDSRKAFEQDMVVWEHLAPEAPVRYARSDRPIIEYRKFCERLVD